MTAREEYATYRRWRAKLRGRKTLLLRARTRHAVTGTAASKRLVTKRMAQVSEARAVVKRHDPSASVAWTNPDGSKVPITRGLLWILRDAKRAGWSGWVNSADRRKGVAERWGRLSQVALHLGWIRRLPGFNPANPPGRSTHELRSDGVAYRGPVGRLLQWWQLGLDVGDASGLLRVLKHLGYVAKRPYSSRSELHHINLMQNPIKRWSR